MSSDGLPELRIAVTASMVARAALAARDWQPQHHDRVWSQEAAGLRDIIMDNYTQSGLIARHIADWAGYEARIGRIRLKMRRSICPGDELVLKGEVQEAEFTPHGFHWKRILIQLQVGGETATEAVIRVAVPDQPGGNAAWSCPPDSWNP